MPLESDYHLSIPAEEEGIVDENAASAAAAANAKIPGDDIQDVPSISRNYSMPDLVEVDSDSDNKEDDQNDNSNGIIGVPVNRLQLQGMFRHLIPPLGSATPIYELTRAQRHTYSCYVHHD